MNLTGLTDPQKQALVDLLVLGMYADGNLDLIEDERARQILDATQFSSDSARQYFIDASFARARRHGSSPDATRKYVAEIAQNFSEPATRRQIYDALQESLASDQKMADQESQLLRVVSREFKI
jgi:hypothetical protein